MNQKPSNIISIAKRTIDLEQQAIASLSDRIGASFELACDIMLSTQGRVIVIGMGKSGHVGRKIAATLASTGTPAFFVHPAEAGHGDMGMVTKNDSVLAISNSGNSSEITSLLPLLKAMGVKLISMTGNDTSAMAQAANAHLNIGVESEACPLNLAPTSSTTNTMVMGDALAICLLEVRGFTAENFAFSHPSGALGKRLLLKVSDVMHSGEHMPKVLHSLLLKKVLAEMSKKGLGITTVIDDNNKLVGVFTDGDLRRIVDEDQDINTQTAASVMNANPLSIGADRLAAEALGLMEEKKVTALVAVDFERQPVGVLHLHDILRSGVI